MRSAWPPPENNKAALGRRNHRIFDWQKAVSVRRDGDKRYCLALEEAIDK
ncbi:MAG TPA: hypothetical protein VNN73_22925 [Blastocatellia bacterium]|jgi:hypothetical protein|nr:hypothetical protein [Blastocatellia bacterium]